MSTSSSGDIRRMRNGLSRREARTIPSMICTRNTEHDGVQEVSGVIGLTIGAAISCLPSKIFSYTSFWSTTFGSMLESGIMRVPGSYNDQNS